MDTAKQIILKSRNVLVRYYATDLVSSNWQTLIELVLSLCDSLSRAWEVDSIRLGNGRLSLVRSATTFVVLIRSLLSKFIYGTLRAEILLITVYRQDIAIYFATPSTVLAHCLDATLAALYIAAQFMWTDLLLLWVCRDTSSMSSGCDHKIYRAYWVRSWRHLRERMWGKNKNLLIELSRLLIVQFVTLVKGCTKLRGGIIVLPRVVLLL